VEWVARCVSLLDQEAEAEHIWCGDRHCRTPISFTNCRWTAC
jgi:hypothetical protein